jgi:hypothetical protein
MTLLIVLLMFFYEERLIGYRFLVECCASLWEALCTVYSSLWPPEEKC